MFYKAIGLLFRLFPSYVCANLSHCWDSILVDNFLDKFDIRAFDIDNPAFTLKEAFKLRRKYIALEVE